MLNLAALCRESKKQQWGIGEGAWFESDRLESNSSFTHPININFYPCYVPKTVLHSLHPDFVTLDKSSVSLSTKRV